MKTVLLEYLSERGQRKSTTRTVEQPVLDDESLTGPCVEMAGTSDDRLGLIYLHALRVRA